MHEVLLVVVDALPSLREVHQLVVLGFAEGLCQLSRCPRCETVFQRVGGGELELLGWSFAILQVRHIAILHELLRVRLAGSKRTVLAIQLVLAASLVGQLHVEVANATLVGRVDEKWQLVGAHARHIAAIGQTVAHPSGILEHLQMGADVIRGVFRIGENPQLSEIPLPAPEGIGVIHVVNGLVTLHGQLTDAPVVTRIGTVDVATQSTS